ncbi:hypothetical protein A5636_16760 [Mycobacterium asiaticum]|uniref:Uncharacterized protein n=1 Tax=Mycobacterium asiaticum TaxID=1790 RepID=A0A1A3NE88_MYCAS|nr:hypothetical protein A5636_16760 [Mycobacterium asiaticum]
MAAAKNRVEAMKIMPATITTQAATRYSRGGFSTYAGAGGVVATEAGGTDGSGVSLMPSNIAQVRDTVKA